MYRLKLPGRNPYHRVIIGFDDPSHTLFAQVVDIQTANTLLDVGNQDHEITDAYLLLDRLYDYLERLPDGVFDRLQVECQSPPPLTRLRYGK